MGGGPVTTPRTFTPEQERDFAPLLSSSLKPIRLLSDQLSGEVEDGTTNEEHGSVYGGIEEVGSRISSSCLEVEANQNKICRAYMEVLESYKQFQVRSKNLKEAKSKILSYTPGGWAEKVGGMKVTDYDVPSTTTLLLIGPKGSGKSSLVNRITNVFEDDIYAPERAQVSYNSWMGDGTYFLQAYMIPRGSTSFCLYDTRSLSDDTSDNIAMVKHWVKKGVCQGKLVIRPSDSSALKNRMKRKARKNVHQSKERSMVNFVIFVVDGLAVLKSMDNDVGGEANYTRMIARTFNCPYLSFKDDKPVVVVTHGDLLSLADRVRVRVHLGELLGIPPAKQIFDIPDSRDPVTESTIVAMLLYCLEHADKNLPHKESLAEKVRRVSASACVFLLTMLAISILSIYIQHAYIRHKSKVHIDWRSIRHIW